jgi:hypothetical protein
VRRFPDGDSHVRIDTPVDSKTIILVCTLDRPDEKFLPLSFMAATVRWATDRRRRRQSCPQGRSGQRYRGACPLADLLPKKLVPFCGSRSRFVNSMWSSDSLSIAPKYHFRAGGGIQDFAVGQNRAVTD